MAIDPQKDCVEFISKLDGIWHEKLNFDGINYWDSSKDFPYILEYENNPLPSDSRFRQDVIFLNLGDKVVS